MAGVPQLKVILGADKRPLTKSLNELKGDLERLKAQLNDAKDPKFISNLNRQIQLTSKNVKILEGHGLQVKRTFADVGKGLAIGLGVAVFQQAQQAASAFFNGAIEEALEAQRAVENLKQSLDTVGRTDALDKFVSAAQELQKEFSYLDNDDITNAFSKLIQFGGLTEKQIRDLIPVIIDLNAKQRLAGETNKSVAETAETVVKALSGQGRELKKYGVDIDASSTLTERLNAVTGILANKVKDAGQAFKNSLEGQLATTAQKVKDLQEELGQKLLPLKVALITFATEGADAFQTLYEKLTGTHAAAEKARRSLDNFDKAKNKAKEFVANENTEGFLSVATDEQFEQFLAYYEKKAQEAANLLADKVSEFPGTSSDDFPAVKKQRDEADELVKALRASRALLKDTSTFGTNNLDGDSGGDAESKIIEALQAQVAEKKKLVEFYPEEISYLKELVALETQLAFLQAKKAGTSDETAKLISTGVEAVGLRRVELAQKASTPLTTRPFSGSTVQTDIASLTGSDKANAEAINGVKKFADDYEVAGKEAFERIQDSTADLTGIVQGSLVGLGEALGETLSVALDPKADAGDIARPVLMLLADIVSQIGKAFIEAGIAMAGAQKSMAVLFSNPATAIAAGIGLVALGAFLKAQLNKKGNEAVKNFAEGGITQSPTLARTSEFGQKEAIIPLDRLPSLINRIAVGGGGNGGVLETRLSLDELVIRLKQREKSLGRRGNY
jgi:hypothetical protein